jgi:hypothetical protein
VQSDVNAVIDINVGDRRSNKEEHDVAQTPETKKDKDVEQVTSEELDEQNAEELPDREAMSLIDANVAVPVNAAVAANVLTDESLADADADQTGDIDQDNVL